jgi:hypothetical protein
MRRLNGDRDLDRERLVDMVETDSADASERERVSAERRGVPTARGLVERRSRSLLAFASARSSSATPFLAKRCQTTQ